MKLALASPNPYSACVQMAFTTKILLLVCYLALVCGQCPSGFTLMRSNPNKCMALVGGGTTADDALNSCKQNLNPGATLISIESAAENDEIRSFIGNGLRGYWIGLLWENGSYTWRNGPAVSFLNILPYDDLQAICKGYGEISSFYWTNYAYNETMYYGFWYNCSIPLAYGICEYRHDTAVDFHYKAQVPNLLNP